MRNQRKEKPGILLPFNTEPTFILLPAEQVKELILACFKYGAGKTPTVESDAVQSVWPTFQDSLERDDFTWYQKSQDGRYGKYRSGGGTMNREDWESRNHEHYVPLAERSVPPANTPNDDDSSSAFERWINYRQYDPAQVELIRTSFSRWEQIHGVETVAEAVDEAIAAKRETLEFPSSEEV